MNIPIVLANVDIQDLYDTAILDNIISVFFEPNGHGGVIADETFQEVI